MPCAHNVGAALGVTVLKRSGKNMFLPFLRQIADANQRKDFGGIDTFFVRLDEITRSMIIDRTRDAARFLCVAAAANAVFEQADAISFSGESPHGSNAAAARIITSARSSRTRARSW